MFNRFQKELLLTLEEIQPGMNVKIVDPSTHMITADVSVRVTSIPWEEYDPKLGLTVIAFYGIIDGKISPTKVIAKYVYLDMNR